LLSPNTAGRVCAIARLVQGVRDVPGLPFNVFHHGSVTTELAALTALGQATPAELLSSAGCG
jgi:hypothetical protein